MQFSHSLGEGHLLREKIRQADRQRDRHTVKRRQTNKQTDGRTHTRIHTQTDAYALTRQSIHYSLLENV